jgi:hypothetical protein
LKHWLLLSEISIIESKQAASQWDKLPKDRHSTGLTQFFLGSFHAQSQVDNLTAGCVKAGLKVVRIGRPEATRFDLEKYNLLEMVKVWLSWLSWLSWEYGVDSHGNPIFFWGWS